MKRHLKQRKQKQKKKKKESDDQVQQDNVKFGEVVQAPPKLSAKPKAVIKTNQRDKLAKEKQDEQRNHIIAAYRMKKNANLSKLS